MRKAERRAWAVGSRERDVGVRRGAREMSCL